MNSIFSTLDYRQWLRKILEERKEKNPRFSMRLFASRAQIDPSLFAKILAEKRHLTQRLVDHLAQELKLEPKEKEYLLLLVNLSKSKHSEKRQEFYEKAMELRKIQNRVVPTDQHAFYAEWYHSPLRNLLQMYPFYGKNFRELGNQLSPPISAQQARESISLLERMGFIRQNEEGRFELSELAVSSGESWKGLALRRHHKRNIELGAEAMDRFPSDKRDISGLTMNLGYNDLKIVQEKIRKFRQDLIQYVNSKAEPENVYQLNLQLFPMSTIKEKL